MSNYSESQINAVIGLAKLFQLKEIPTIATCIKYLDWETTQPVGAANINTREAKLKELLSL